MRKIISMKQKWVESNENTRSFLLYYLMTHVFGEYIEEDRVFRIG